MLQLKRKGIVFESKETPNYYSISDSTNVIESVLKLSKFDRFKSRAMYLETAFNACLTKSLPEVFHALKEEPGLSDAEEIGSRTVLHSESNKMIYEYFGALKRELGDIREDILIPASVWIDYLLLLSEKKAGETND
ncbi:hypothetical protein [Paenibacillus arenosi]|uniref:Uncharacterized protein n=1 Tax=Paenibacillus arenosi TaxID=2774142 RepID=A0ABR9AZ85_9BACL|nr:hypothetical protein [Paenibacillus arenosi]MBD8498515.1 hypothetical protein [Paenibacillus arenosi]